MLEDRIEITSNIRRHISRLYSLMETFHRKVMDDKLKNEDYKSWVEKEFIINLKSAHQDIECFLEKLRITPSSPTFTGKNLNEIISNIAKSVSCSLPNMQDRSLWSRQMFSMIKDYNLSVEVLMKNRPIENNLGKI